MKIVFLGGGNMAAALIGGMLERGFDAHELSVVELAPERREWLVGQFGVGVTGVADDVVREADAVVLAVKPQQMREAVEPLAGRLERALVVSVAAGLRIGDLSRWLDGFDRIVRAMPNTPALVGAGVSGLCAGPGVDGEDRELAGRMLASVGSVVWVEDEARMDAVTAVSGSGPAYVFHFIEALEAAAVARGFDADTARRLAIDTVLGAAKLAAESDDGPDVLRQKVTSRGGTTAAALAVFEQGGFMGLVDRAVAAAEARGRALGEELGRG
ncbi:pyrroline-5-carboxylate reductase [Pseudazoarcus pumilus]|uniref:Pyrroline-5-carboxylate reductase n=1 Tax=Pseudazoarcus pumilus TaxID=2067960 RepID=A0A2I6S3W0_9RHOO|nr:pyrroline-5-carboxylate reductase [Pseudazoarcus pumilus]AUN93942.1 pyrroline-5-carboxylate reductase [Pseudazoarcus pumilus]